MTRLAHACKIRNTYPDFHPDYLIVVVLGRPVVNKSTTKDDDDHDYGRRADCLLVVVLGLLVVNKSTTRTSTTTMRGI
jgi:hypothetical protein